MVFGPPALAGPASAAINDVAILALQPPLSPPTPLPPRRAEKGSSTALCGRVLEVVEFTVSRQPSKSTQAASVASQAHVVPGEFECWRLPVNATPHTALATYGC